MANVAEIIVRIATETKGDAGKELSGTAARVDAVSSKMKKFAVPAAAAAGAVLAFGKSAAEAASRTQQAMGGIDAVFGKNAGQVKKWADSAAQSLGLAKSEYGELATIIGSQLKNMGLPMDKVAGQTNDLIKLGADLAATYGGTTAEAVEALSATLRGETDPIERYGVSINAAAIKAKQAADGTADLEGAAGKQAKTMATLALITDQTAAAHGKFAEESDTAAGQSQRASAEFENMQSALGMALLPAITAVAKVLGELAQAAAAHPKLFQAIAAVVLVLAAVILTLAGAMRIYNLVMAITAAVNEAAWLSALGPILLVVAAVAAAVAIVVVLWKKSDTFRTAVLATWAAIQAAATGAWNVIKAVGSVAIAALTAYVRVYLSVAQTVFNAVRAAVGAVSSAVSDLIAWIRRITVPDSIKSAFDGVKTAIGHVSTAISTMIGWVAKIVPPVDISAPFNTAKTAIGHLIDAVESLIGWLGRIKVPKIHIPGVGKGKSVATAGTVTRYGVPVAPAVGAPRVGGLYTTTSRAAAAPTVTINVSGALDPESVARQIRRLLGAHDRRTGGAAVVFR